MFVNNLTELKKAFYNDTNDTSRSFSVDCSKVLNDTDRCCDTEAERKAFNELLSEKRRRTRTRMLDNNNELPKPLRHNEAKRMVNNSSNSNEVSKHIVKNNTNSKPCNQRKHKNKEEEEEEEGDTLIKKMSDQNLFTTSTKRAVILYTKRIAILLTRQILLLLLLLFTNNLQTNYALYLHPTHQLSPSSSSPSSSLAQSSSINAINEIAPTIDYSHNMRILKLPQSTQVGSIVYRLKGSDGDPNTKLTFGISGGFGIGRTLLDVVPVPHSWNEADVYLRSQLEQSHYNLTIYVTDGNKTTQVESTIIVTEPLSEFIANTNDNISDNNNNNSEYYLQQTNLTLTPTSPMNNNNNLSPFVNTKHVFYVPENTKLNEPIGFVSVLESLKSDLPVRFELRGKGADKFSIKYVFGPKGQSKGEIILAHELDYEKQNLFTLKVLALNAWTNIRYDTRNVATMDIVISVGDVQDTKPIFKYQSMPKSILLPNTAQANEIVFKVEAEDGDYADQRPINYALDAQSPLANYFTINKQTGEIMLLKAANELALHASWDSSDWSILTIFASEVPDTTSYDHFWPPMFSKFELPIMLVDVANEPPQFIGGWQTAASTSTNLIDQKTNDLNQDSNQTLTNNKILHGYVNEIPGNLVNHHHHHQTQLGIGDVVRWYTNTSETGQPLVDELTKSMGGRPLVLDLGLGSNGTFELYLEGPDSSNFQIDPQFPVSKQTTFTITINPNANKTLFDYDQQQHQQPGSFLERPRRTFSFNIVARDFGVPIRKSSRIKCLIELLDLNDNLPQFESDLYSFNVYENAQAGTIVGTVRARDLDNNSNFQNRIKYYLLNEQEMTNSQTSSSSSSPSSSSSNQIIKALFKLDPDNGQLILHNHLDREKKSTYLLVVGARDFLHTSTSDHLIMNYTQVLINVLDVNDNAPIFQQDHYDAVLKSDGTFYQPLQVKAIDNDEPNTANSQVAYEIIAGNLNDQFSIDSVSGIIYPTITTSNENYLSPNNNNNNIKNTIPQIPPILTEPIVPFNSNSIGNQAGKILPASHEIEETTYPSPRLISSNKILQQHQQIQNQSKLLLLANNNNINDYNNHAPINQDHDRLIASSSSKVAAKHKIEVEITTKDNNRSTTATKSNKKRLVKLIESNENNKLEESVLNPNKQQNSPHLDTDQLPALDLLLNLESNHESYLPLDRNQDSYDDDSSNHEDGSIDKNKRSLLSDGNGNYYQNNIIKVPPITTLIVRAHDFGIPLRSSTVKVNIYNQALLLRSVSVLLNGTVEQLESRRDLLERAFSSVTGSKATLESIYSLSDSSSISVARFKLAVPQNSLVDLTDLTALMNALDYYHYNNHHTNSRDAHSAIINHQSTGQAMIHYIAAGDKLIPITPSRSAANITNVHGGHSQQAGLFNDIYSVALDNNNQLLERKLLIYIIIAVFCIAILLLIWMVIYCCSRDNSQQLQQIKLIDSSKNLKQEHQTHKKEKILAESYKARKEGDDELYDDDYDRNKTHVKRAETTTAAIGANGLSPIGNNLAKQQQQQQKQQYLNMDRNSMMTNNSELLLVAPNEAALVNRENMTARGQHLSTATNLLKPDRFSMYNGQVWFEPTTGSAATVVTEPSGNGQKAASARRAQMGLSRRASSAPSGSGSLDSALNSVIDHKQQQQRMIMTNNGTIIRDGSGQFFPNAIGYMENLNALGQQQQQMSDNKQSSRMFYKRSGKNQNKIAPMPNKDLYLTTGRLNKGVSTVDQDSLDGSGGHTNKAFEHDNENDNLSIERIKHHYMKNAGGGHHLRGQRDRPQESSRSTSSAGEESSIGADSSNAVILDSDQELLGYDSTGTPIIATHTRRAPGSIIVNSNDASMKPLLVDMMMLDQQLDNGSVEDARHSARLSNKQIATGSYGSQTKRLQQAANINSNDKSVQSQNDGEKVKRKNLLGGTTTTTTTATATEGATTGNKNEQTNSIKTNNKSEDITSKSSNTPRNDAGGGGGGHKTSEQKSTSTTNDDAENRTKSPSSSTKSNENKVERQKANNSKGDLMSELNDKLINRQKQSDASSSDVKVRFDEEKSPQMARLTKDEGTTTILLKNGGPTKQSDAAATQKSATITMKRKQLERGQTNDDNSKAALQAAGSSGDDDSNIVSSNENEEKDNKTEKTNFAGLRDMKNGELLEKQSIFAITYSGLATDKLPV